MKPKPEQALPGDYDSDDDSCCASVVSDTRGCTDSNETSKGNDSSSGESNEIASEESRKIYALRFFIFSVLILSVAGALAVFFYLRYSEMTKFEEQFDEDAIKVLSSLGATLDFMLGAMDALVISFVSYAKESNQTWPFVVIPDFDVRAGKVKALSNAYIINIYANVQADQRKEWENFTSMNNGWVAEGLEIQENDSRYTGPIVKEYEMWDKIHDYGEFEKENPGEFGTDRDGPYLPWWQCVPVIPIDPPYNWDMMSWFRPSIESVLTTHRVSISDTYLIAYPNETEKIKENEAEAEWIKDYIPPDQEPNEPVADIYVPIIADAADTMDLFHDREGNSIYNPTKHKLGGILALSSYWRDKIKDILPKGSDGVVIVFENPCNPTFTYQINGPSVVYLGTGDHHDSEYDHLEHSSALHDLRKFAIKESSYSGIPIADNVCPYTIRVFPSDTMKNHFVTDTPILLSVSAGALLLIFALIFFIYDKWVQRRQDIVTNDAAKSAAIVSSMFPKEIQQRMMEEQETANQNAFMSRNKRLKTFLNDGTEDSLGMAARPIADLFPHTTVIFADISGFTAWSSTRDPSQVFMLLETIYKAFDDLARRRKVFKVETVGDCYVAVTGLPSPQEKHAILMARFAGDCLQRFRDLGRTLESSLGPDCADLCLRVGLHSGPVTAGVLRGDRSRFQLFGDTVNTAARMESTCATNKIQVSHTTAALLKEAGKGHWLERREDKVVAKGKGVLDTYWLLYRPSRAASVASEQSSTGKIPRDLSSLRISSTGHKTDRKKHKRLVSWVSELLLSHVKKVVIRHEANGFKPDHPSKLVYNMPAGNTCMDELVEIFKLPEFDEKAAASAKHHNQVEISSTVVEQLRSVVSEIAYAYNNNHFHNFEHACHVTMSVDKFLQRVVAPDILDEAGDVQSKTKLASNLHDYTYGITSDPLSVLGIVFSALIHDVDHRGVSNMQLANEDERLAKAYDKSIAEQNSMDMAWEILMKPKYSELRTTLFCTRSEMMRFRQVVVNIVLATDIFHKELNDLRKNRWNRAFSGEADTVSNDPEHINRKATIVIEHIMQASDVSHTMQHWHVYRKWNERLFLEMHTAYKAGRMGKDPAEFWYKGEIGFFDNYIIPLAQKLRDCKVFGVSSDEVLNYAKENREEWKERGEEVVAYMIEKADALERESLENDHNANMNVIQENGEGGVEKQSMSNGDIEC